MDQDIAAIVHDILMNLAARQYDALELRHRSSRMSAEEMHDVIIDYGRVVIGPPHDWAKYLSIVEVVNFELAKFSVVTPLWTAEEGRSDLSLELWITFGRGEPVVEIDSIHVL